MFPNRCSKCKRPLPKTRETCNRCITRAVRKMKQRSEMFCEARHHLLIGNRITCQRCHARLKRTEMPGVFLQRGQLAIADVI